MASAPRGYPPTYLPPEAPEQHRVAVAIVVVVRNDLLHVEVTEAPQVGPTGVPSLSPVTPASLHRGHVTGLMLGHENDAERGCPCVDNGRQAYL